MTNITLSGISFADLPHITNKSYNEFGELVKGEEAVVIRENGEVWDSDALPAYSVRLMGMHVGYIPLVETAKEEWMKARDGYRKKWKDEYEGLSKDQLRAASKAIIQRGELPRFHDWEFVGTETMKPHLHRMLDRCAIIEVVRDQLYVDFNRNHTTPMCMVQAVYFDKTEGRNYNEVGEICSVTASFADIY